MKIQFNSSFFLAALVAGFGLMLTGGATAQTFSILHGFTAVYGSSSNNADGATPYASLLLSGNTLYGTAVNGGTFGRGTVFAVNTDGTGFTNLYSFSHPSGANATNSDGANPYAELILSGDTLYGTASAGGTGGSGTVFAVNTDGTGFTNLHSFAALVNATNGDGANSHWGLILSGNALYGTTESGGIGGSGTVFKLNTGGTGFTNLHAFTATFGPAPATNMDGAHQRGLLLLGDTLYGMATYGGAFGYGALFAVTTNGMGFTNLHAFTSFSDGSFPNAGFALQGYTLFGTAVQGGASGNGILFAVNTDSSGFTNLYTFTRGSGAYPSITNIDGANPVSGVVLSGNTLYGTTVEGGNSANGTVFAVNTDGSAFTNLHTFTGGSDGGFPYGTLIVAGETLYGSARQGGNSGSGTVFSISLAPKLAITATGPNVILTWPTNVAGFDYSGFTLQSATNFPSTNWTAVSPPPVVNNGQNTVTNAISGAQIFYRLIQ